jgi:putative transposase
VRLRSDSGKVRPSARSGIGITEQSYYRWRREYGGLKLDQAKRLKDLERENDRLKKAVSELTLDKLILKEALGGKY